MRSNAIRPEIVNTEPYFQIVKRQLSEKFPKQDISELKGDSAAHVKVSNQGISGTSMYYYTACNCTVKLTSYNSFLQKLSLHKKVEK
jgi:hypothetical protein